MKNTLPMLMIAALLSGCGTTTVSPFLRGKDGVTIGVNPDGYPTVESVVFQRPAAPPAKVLVCMQTEIDDLKGQPVEVNGAVKAKGQTFASVGFSNYLTYALTVNGGRYTFDRLYHAGDNGPTYKLIASAHGRPENAYAALERTADLVSECASR